MLRVYLQPAAGLEDDLIDGIGDLHRASGHSRLGMHQPDGRTLLHDIGRRLSMPRVVYQDRILTSKDSADDCLLARAHRRTCDDLVSDLQTYRTPLGCLQTGGMKNESATASPFNFHAGALEAPAQKLMDAIMRRCGRICSDGRAGGGIVEPCH